jgi:hypothetical protein
MRKLIAWLTKELMPFRLVIIGGVIGWLIGLSISPVVSIVITSITTAAAALIAALSGLQDKQDEANRQQTPILRWNVDPRPLMMLVIGILAGSLLGIKARNDGWLGNDLSIEIKKWTNAGLLDSGLTKEEMVRRLFESQYYTTTTTVAAGSAAMVPNHPLGTILFNTSSPTCEGLLAASTRTRVNADGSLANALRASTVTQLQNLPDLITDTVTLAEVVEEVICADGSSPP